MTEPMRSAGIGRIVLVSMAVIICAWLTAPLALAQSAGSTIQGTVKDESGAAVPGVTVTIAAPELQVGKVSAVSEADGTYRVRDLPAGTYRISFELAGFKTVVQADFRLSIGFVARVDATMLLGGLEESVTVSGASPVVDLTSTTTSSTVTRETMDSVPVSQGLTNLYAITPGVTTSVVDVGGSQTGKRVASQNYGPGQNSTIRIDGIDIADGTDTGVYSSSFSLEEAQIRTSGNDAEVATPGTAMIGVIKSGSNDFHGMFGGETERPALQSSNLSDVLRAQGLSNTNPIRRLDEMLTDFGGRLIKDKLWFYAGASRSDRLAGVPGFVNSPTDPTPAYVESRLIYVTTKVSYQATPKNRLIAAWQPNTKSQPQGLPPEPSRFVPLSSTLDFYNPNHLAKGEIQSALSNRIVLNVVGGSSGFYGLYCPACSKFADPVVPSNPSTSDLQSGIKGGSNPKNTVQHSNNWDLNGSLSMLPDRFLGGKHELKVGSSLNWHERHDGQNSSPAGNYILVFDTINGVPHQPSQIQIGNGPVYPDPRTTSIATYVKDSWRIGDNLTLNLGARLERNHGYIAKQSRDASPDFPSLFPAGQFDPIDVQTWMKVVPRVGFAWNLASKTVWKGTHGRFLNGQPGGVGGGSLPNPMAVVTDTFRWHDLNGDSLYQPGEVNLDLNSTDFLSTTATLPKLTKDLKPPMTNEATTSVERELRANMGVRVLYVFKQIVDQYTTTNTLRPRSAYNIPLTRTDPGADGVVGTPDDGGPVTIYDFDAAYKGAAFVNNVLQNYPDMTDHYQTIQLEFTKRQSGRWSTTAAFWTTKFHQHQVLTTAGLDPSNPNTDANSIDEAWRWAWNLTGTYTMPWGIQFGAYVQCKNGVLGQRTAIFRAVDPSGGPSLQQQSTVTQALTPMGSVKGAAINVVNLRSSKTLSVGKGQRLELDFDLFNLLNSSAPLIMTFQSGPTFGYATDVVPARIARVGFRYTF